MQMCPAQTRPDSTGESSSSEGVVIGNNIHAIGQDSTMITIIQIGLQSSPQQNVYHHMKSCSNIWFTMQIAVRLRSHIQFTMQILATCVTEYSSPYVGLG